jgi:hypothetical protein
MLGPGRYLLGVAEIAALATFAWLGASSLRKRLVPELTGPTAHLANLVLALALLIWVAELLGTFGAFEAVPYLCAVGLASVFCWALSPRVLSGDEGGPAGQAVLDPPHPLPPAGGAQKETRNRSIDAATVIALVVAAAAVLHFAGGVRSRLSTGMTGFDSTWYHGPFAAAFFQTGNTWDLHFIAPQFLAWFYPANSEVLHAVGMSAFDRDILSPLLNLGWFVACLFACWCLGRPFRVAPWTLGLGAVALSLPALSDQAGEARNDIVGIFFLLAAAALAVNAWEARRDRAAGLGGGALFLAALAAGLSAGTKLDFVLPAIALVVGLAAIQAPGARMRSLGLTALGGLAGGGYWYLRNLIHSGNPLPWFDQIGPLSLPAPDQALGGREQHTVLSYLTEGSVWSEWFLPGFHHGFGILWPLLLGLALAGLLLCLGGRGGTVLRVVAVAGLASALAWLVAPTSASGPQGMPHGFESGLRYLAPALVLGMALLPLASPIRERLARSPWLRSHLLPHSGKNYDLNREGTDDLNRDETALRARRWPLAVGVALTLVAIAIGYPVQRHYLRDRYADPSFTTPGLNAAFRWARGISGARIGTTSTRQYPLFGTDLSNRVQFVGEHRARGGFVAPSSCEAWRRLLNEGGYDYVVASRDRVQPGKPAYPPTAEWTEGPGARAILRVPPTVVFRLTGRLDPASCPS